MAHTIEQTLYAEKTSSGQGIPECLVYEMADGSPIYYRGYQAVLSGEKDPEEVMGSSFIQSLIITRILRFLMLHLSEEYEVLTNELGIQFSKGNWRAADIAIFRKEQLHNLRSPEKYVDVPPEVVIEVDTRADIEQFVTSMDYYYSKTDALLLFGVKKVIWIYSDARKVLLAEAGKDWLTRNWDAEIPVLNDLSLRLSELVDKV